MSYLLFCKKNSLLKKAFNCKNVRKHVLVMRIYLVKIYFLEGQFFLPN